MRVTVCELPHQHDLLESASAALCVNTRSHRSELFVLPEFSFVEPIWLRKKFDDTLWVSLVARSETWVQRLDEFGASTVIGARPVLAGGQPYNEAFLWSKNGSVTPLRRKAYLPEEPGGWEARWLTRGVAEFPALVEGDNRFGINICMELWSLEACSGYAEQGVQAIVSPRATAAALTAKWLAPRTVAAVRSGAYILSSNRVHGDDSCGGVAWIIGPDGQHLALTSPEQPVCTVDIDLTAAVTAKASYPRYVFAEPGRTS